MARQYVKKNNSLTSVTTPSMKVYPNIDAVEAAIESGELKEGEVFGTEASNGIHTDITTLVYTMWAATPANASSENKFVVQSDLRDLDITSLANKVDTSTFNSSVTGLQNDITTLNNRIDNLDLSCFGGLTCSGWKDLIQCMINACLGVLPTSPTGADNQIYIGQRNGS